ncbi:MAG: RHS repeat-associated core domain-containing protein [Candidatus Obscuribacterales bacterium]
MLTNKRKTFPVGSSIAPGNSPLQGRMHAMSPKDSKPMIEGRQQPKKVFDMKTIPALRQQEAALLAVQQGAQLTQQASLQSLSGPLSLTNPAVPSIAELAAALNNDVDEIYRFVANKTGYINTYGSQKGALTTLIDHYGNSFDQAALMVALLRAAGKTANFMFGQLKLTPAEAGAWLGTDPNNVWASRNMLGNGGVPVDVIWDGVNFVYYLTLSHCWVKVDVTGAGNWYVFDPAFKSHTFTAGVDLATITGFNATNFQNSVMSGATVTADSFQNVNTANLNSEMVTLNDNLITWISANKPDATLKDLIGGKDIIPVTGVVRNTSLPYQDSSVTPTEWTVIPNAYKTTFRVEFDGIDQTFYSEDISSKNLTLFFNGSLEAELRLDGTLLDTSVAQGVGTWNSALLTINHPYAVTWANQSFWQRVWAGDHYLIAHSWGNSTPDMAFMHQQLLNDNVQDGFADSAPEVLGESLAVLWHNWCAQKTIMCSMLGQMKGCVAVLHHQVGMVGHGEAPFTDLGGIVWSTSALDNDYNKVAATDTVIALRGIGFESGTINQVPGIGAVSSNNVISQANDAGQKLFVATSSNWATVRPQLLNYDTGDLDNLTAWYINNGWSLLIHENGHTDQNSYQGYGIYAISPWGGCVGLINGMLLGGAADEVMAIPQMNLNTSVNQRLTDNLERVEVGSKIENPVDFITDKKTGRTLYRHADISVGNGNGALELIRTYNSRDSATVTEVGRGWRHNFLISIEIQNQAYASIFDTNNPQPPAGQNAGLSASGPLIHAMIQIFLAPGVGSPASFVIGAISTTEASKLLTNNVAILRDGDRSYTFTKLSNGVYVPPKGVPMLLTKLTDHFVMQTFEGVRYTFTNWALNTTRVSKIEWPAYGSGRVLDFTYGGVGPEFYLTSVVSNFGRSLTFAYTLVGGLVPYLSSVTSAGGLAHSSYTFDIFTNGHLTSCNDQAGISTSYTYDGKRRLTAYTRPTYSCSVTYDDQDRVVTQNNPGYTLSFQYGSDFTSVQGGPDGGVFTTFNTDGLPLSIRTGGDTVKFSYDGLGRVTTKTLPHEDSISYQYDQYNRVSQEIHSPGPGGGLPQTNTYGYNPAGVLTTWEKWVSRTDERGQNWARVYDGNGNLTSQTSPTVNGQTPVKTWSYNQYNDLVTEVDETGIVTTYTYGSPGDVATVVHDSGVGRLNLTSSFGYDPIGNRTSSTNARGFNKIMTFDPSRRVTSITETGLGGYVTSFSYDAAGNVLSTSKQYGGLLQQQVASATYSAAGQKLTETDPLGWVTNHSYDTQGRRISTTDPELRQRQFQYDSSGRLTAIIDANGVAEETRTYDSYGYLATIKDARNNVTTYTRDGFGRAKQVTYPGGSYEAMTFDVSGNPLTHRMRNANVITNTYDVLGRLATKSPQGQAVVTYSYDKANRLLSVSTPVVSGNPSTGVFSHGYDTAGRLISETNPQSQVMGYTLDANGNATRITHPGGYFVDRVYDQLDRLTDIKLNGSGSSAVTFGYDQLSRRISKNYANGANTTYSYDLGNNLLTMNIAFVGSACNWSYSYNKVHQMLSSNCSDTNYYWRATAGAVNYAAANNLNQYPTVGGLAATYNTLGALATYNTWTYTYNTEQMLTAASKSGTSASFVYDPKLRQIQKTVGSAKTKYVYSGSHMMEEWNGVANTLTTRYVYAGADEPVLQMTSAGVVTYIHHDHHGSVIAQSNATTGAVGNIYKYGPFGEGAATLPGTTIGYTGQRYDTELGLYHYKARYFHPGIGRFLQPDPVGYSAGMNLYTYCSNDGLNHTDPDGLEGIPWWLDFTPKKDKYGGPNANVTPGLPGLSLKGSFDVAAGEVRAAGKQAIVQTYKGTIYPSLASAQNKLMVAVNKPAHGNSLSSSAAQSVYDVNGRRPGANGQGPIERLYTGIAKTVRETVRMGESVARLRALGNEVTDASIVHRIPEGPNARAKVSNFEMSRVIHGKAAGGNHANIIGD